MVECSSFPPVSHLINWQRTREIFEIDVTKSHRPPIIEAAFSFFDGADENETSGLRDFL
jgi:hypothetical protein